MNLWSIDYVRHGVIYDNVRDQFVHEASGFRIGQEQLRSIDEAQFIRWISHCEKYVIDQGLRDPRNSQSVIDHLVQMARAALKLSA